MVQNSSQGGYRPQNRQSPLSFGTTNSQDAQIDPQLLAVSRAVSPESTALSTLDFSQSNDIEAEFTS
jgi:hypothetical protein